MNEKPDQRSVSVTGCVFTTNGDRKFEAMVELAKAMGELARALGGPLHTGPMLSIGDREDGSE